jgi:hypothetical protein
VYSVLYLCTIIVLEYLLLILLVLEYYNVVSVPVIYLLEYYNYALLLYPSTYALL